MADWFKREIVTIRYEWVVPVREGSGGTDWNQVQQALDAAIGEWRRRHHPGFPSTIPSDDVIQVTPRDNEIVIWFKEEGIPF